MHWWSVRDVVLCADAREALAGLADASVDAVVADPPAGIAFMGKEWDRPDRFPLRERGPLRGVAGSTKQTAHAHERGFANGMHIESTGRARDTFIVGLAAVFTECRRVLKPGAYALVWALPRTSHWTAMALEDAGFEIRDSIHHLFGSGFPKGKSCLKPAHEVWWLAKAPGPLRPLQIDACRLPTGGEQPTGGADRRNGHIYAQDEWTRTKTANGGNVTPPSGRWPSNLLLSHHPDCQPAGVRRVRGDAKSSRGASTHVYGNGKGFTAATGEQVGYAEADGYETVDAWTCVDGCPIKALDEQAGPRTSGKPGSDGHVRNAGPGEGIYGSGRGLWRDAGPAGHLYGDTGSASRFFPSFAPEPQDTAPFRYCAKASRSERNAGCDDLPYERPGVLADDSYVRPADGKAGDTTRTIRGNTHPCVKPLGLMSWLVKLVTPPAGLVLDPFCGSGSTLVACVREGMSFIGIDQDEQYCEIARQRVAYEQQRQTGPLFAGVGEG